MNQDDKQRLQDGARILVLTSSSTGNNVFCTPAISLLRRRFPHSRIDVAALSKLSAEVFENNPDVGQVHVVKNAKALDKLAPDYDSILALNANALKKMKGAKATMLTVGPLSEKLHHAEQLLQFVAGLAGVEVLESDRRYVVSGKPFVGKLALDRASLASDSLLVNIHLGCGRTLLHGWKFFYRGRANDKKMWPIQSYVELGKQLIAANPRIRIVLTGTANEAYLAKQFCRLVPGSINLAGKTTVPQLTALMKSLSLFIAHDCGVLHIAAASAVPIVALFGPTNEVLTGPYPLRPQHRLLKKPSMTDITPAEASAAAIELMAAFPRTQTQAS